MFLRDIVHDICLESASEIQVFKPDEITLVLCAVKNRFDIGQSGENRGNKAYCAYPRVINLFHGSQSSFNTDSLLQQ